MLVHSVAAMACKQLAFGRNTWSCLQLRSLSLMQCSNCCPSGADGLFMVVDEKGIFRDDNFQKGIAALTDANADGGAAAAARKSKESKEPGGKRGGTKATDCYKLVKLLMQRNYDPLIVFR